MKRPLILLSALLALSCSVPGPAPVPVAGAVCRVTPEGGPVADRGIGGTGIEKSVADRGIGGTGVTPRLADRGIGGTGIVGVITGFASICVDGLEVGVGNDTPVEIDGAAATPAALRAGQVVAIEATSQNGALNATRVVVRHEVEGPIDSQEAGSKAIVVAGQRVSFAAQAWNAGQFGLGDIVKISGLRAPDGSIVASRIDAGSADQVQVRGLVSADGATLRIGALRVRASQGAALTPGQYVAVSGTRAGGTLAVRRTVPDLLAQNPSAYFGNAVSRLVIQSIVRPAPGGVLLNGHVPVSTAPGVTPAAGSSLDAVVSLDRGPDGSLTATSVKESDKVLTVPVVVPTSGAATPAGTSTAQPAAKSAAAASATTSVQSTANSVTVTDSKPEASATTPKAATATPAPAANTAGARTPVAARPAPTTTPAINMGGTIGATGKTGSATPPLISVIGSSGSSRTLTIGTGTGRGTLSHGDGTHGMRVPAAPHTQAATTAR
jgi:Domain of unknown function (DUF5666)